MKVTNKICQILSIVFSVVALAFFFTSFATVVSSESTVLTGAQLAFGGKVDFAGLTIKMAKSADIWFCAILTILSVLFSALTFKFKGMRFASPAFAVVAAVYMLVITLSNPAKFVDTRPIPSTAAVTEVTYHSSVMIVTIALFVCVVFGVAHLLIADKIEAAASKKPTIIQKVVAFFRDYKSEVKKIVWPNFKSVVKNTVIVLIMCLIIGAFIWLLDFGLGKLLGLVLGL